MDLARLCRRLGIPDDERARDAIGDLLIVSPSLPEDVLESVDRLYRASPPETVSVRDTAVAGWRAGGAEILVCRGDITRLADVDAIVNPANAAGLGCFQPSHRCLDNVIHRASGPRLRAECAERMRDRAPLDWTPMLTRGYHLPMPHVLHVAGPIVRDGQPTPADRQHLGDCYRGCLDAAAAHALRRIAFCCIGTGLYGYPPHEAASVALSAVTEWLHANPRRVDLVVFDVYGSADERIYRALQPSTLCGAPTEPTYLDWSRVSATTSAATDTPSATTDVAPTSQRHV